MHKELSQEIRSHKDLEKDSCAFWRPAVKFYEQIATTLVQHAHALDVFACALEQSGLAEMKPAIQGTGGLVVQTDTFQNPMFKDSLTRVFANSSDEGFSGRSSCATLDVFTSRDIKLQVCCCPRASFAQACIAMWTASRQASASGITFDSPTQRCRSNVGRLTPCSM